MNAVSSENITPYKVYAKQASQDDEVIRKALAILARRFQRGETLTSPSSVTDFLKLRLADHEHEVFGVLWLDNRHRVIEIEELFRGTIDGASVYPREVVKQDLSHNAAAVVLYHNHPSCIAEPSNADKFITQRLIDALKLIDVRVLDHLVVAGAEHVSFAERGLI